MIYHQQQQRSKDKLSPSANKKDEEQQLSLNNKLPDVISNTKPLLPPPLPSTSDLSLPLPSTYQTPLLPPPAFSMFLYSFQNKKIISILYLDYRSPFDFAGVNNGPFGRVPPSSNTAFGGLGSLFPPPPPPPSSSLNHKLPDLISNTKPLFPPPLPSTNDLSLPLPSTYPTPLLPPPTFSRFSYLIVE